jgi:hypothetical protein
MRPVGARRLAMPDQVDHSSKRPWMLQFLGSSMDIGELCLWISSPGYA